MFTVFFIFDALAKVLATEVRLGFFSVNISILGSFEPKFKINFPGKERVPWERGCPVYTHPQDHLRFQDGGGGLER